jgi:hypothetical protein
MPAIRYYIVEQVRQIEVRANSPLDAAILATAKFEGNEKPDDIPGSSGQILVTGLEVKTVDR